VYRNEFCGDSDCDVDVGVDVCAEQLLSWLSCRSAPCRNTTTRIDSRVTIMRRL
jgi:hypothetical protein